MFSVVTEPIVSSTAIFNPEASLWGIGRRLSAAQEEMGIYTALQLRDADAPTLRRRFGVVMEKTIRKLRGQACLELEELAPAKKQIIASRSFGQATSDMLDLEDALAHFVSIAAAKLRAQNSVANLLQVFLMTDRLRPEAPQHCPSVTVPLPRPTPSTIELQDWAVQYLHAMAKAGFAYRKAGVMLGDIVPQSSVQADLFAQEPSDANLMRVLDQVNARYGKGTLRLSQDKARNRWAMKQEFMSPAYTTDWDQIPRCH